MREILFRGKSQETGEWLYGDLTQWKEKKSADILPQEEIETLYDFEVDPESVGQKIAFGFFEGDIVTVKGAINDNPRLLKWGDIEFVMDPAYEPKSLYELMASDRLVHIGNIYENPELIQP